MATHREEQRKQAKAIADMRERATERFFDTTVPMPDRMQAACSAGTFTEGEETRHAVSLLTDRDEPTGVRLSALAGLGNALMKDEALLDQVVAIIADPTQPEALRVAAVNALENTAFGARIMATQRPAFFNALRGILDDDRHLELRAEAMEYLALHGDDYVQERLVDGLQDPKRAIAAPEVAIQLLANNLHAEVFPLLRQIAAHPPNAASRKEALRNLAADPGASDLLEQALRDPNEDPEIRHVCAVGLFQTQPALAVSIAREVVQDEGTDDELRAALLNTLTLFESPDRTSDTAFEAYVEQLETSAPTSGLQRMANRYLGRIKSP